MTDPEIIKNALNNLDCARTLTDATGLVCCLHEGQAAATRFQYLSKEHQHNLELLEQLADIACPYYCGNGNPEDPGPDEDAYLIWHVTEGARVYKAVLALLNTGAKEFSREDLFKILATE